MEALEAGNGIEKTKASMFSGGGSILFGIQGQILVICAVMGFVR